MCILNYLNPADIVHLTKVLPELKKEPQFKDVVGEALGAQLSKVIKTLI